MLCIIPWLLIGIIIPQLQCIPVAEEFHTPEDYLCMKKVEVDKTFIEDHVYENATVRRGNDKLDEYMECWGQEMKLFDENYAMIPSTWKPYILRMIFKYFGIMEDPKKEEVTDMVVDNCKRLKPGRNNGDTVLQALNCVTLMVYKHSKGVLIEL